MGCVHPVAAFNFLPNRFFGRGLELPDWGTSEKKWCTSVVARVKRFHPKSVTSYHWTRQQRKRYKSTSKNDPVDTLTPPPPRSTPMLAITGYPGMGLLVLVGNDRLCRYGVYGVELLGWWENNWLPWYMVLTPFLSWCARTACSESQTFSDTLTPCTTKGKGEWFSWLC